MNKKENTTLAAGSSAPSCSEFPSAAELQMAAGVCLRVAFVLSHSIPWWKRWMYSLAALQTVGEKLSAMSAIVTPNASNEVRKNQEG
jgi:hypothetical protein